MRTATTMLEGAPGSVPVARRWARHTLDEWGLHDAVWAAVQVVSELATNCALHARMPFRLTFELDDGGLRLEVLDHSPAVLTTRRHSDTATTGRGLHIVETLALQWGVVQHDPGKTVWVQLPVSTEPHDVQGHVRTDPATARGDEGAHRPRLRCVR